MKYLPSFLGILFAMYVYIVYCKKDAQPTENSQTILGIINQVETLESGSVEIPITKYEYRRIKNHLDLKTIDSTSVSVTYIVFSKLPYRGCLGRLTVYQ